MKKEKNRPRTGNVFSILFSLVISGEITTILCFAKIYNGDYYLPIAKYLIVFIFIAIIVLISGLGKFRRGLVLSIVLAVFMTGAAYLLPKAGNYYVENVVYDTPDTKKELYSDKKVMLLVPHQDDEINVLGGVIEEYINYGSEVYVVFSTNGDYYGQEEQRFQEVEQVLGPLGVNNEHIITLGYGNGWREGHLYNAEPNQAKVSSIGNNKTQGVGKFPAFDEGKPYTKRAFEEDVKNVILKYLPDTIFCVDYDSNNDHKALSMTFEKVMGEILAETNYRPDVLKGFAYSTAWTALDDYSESVNVMSTKNPWDTEYMQENNIYMYMDRERLPVRPQSLARDIEMSPLYNAFSRYLSQGSYLFAPAVINSDKVFWLRETGSLCYNANISASSGEAEKLNNFMLVDSENIEDKTDFCAGTWIPDEEDNKKEIIINLDTPQTLQRINLYDNPSIEDNILKLEISFDDGTKILTGPLMKNGSETVLTIEKENVSTVKFRICQSEGNKAGLTEVEFFDKEEINPFRFIKITDLEDNFIYDYVTDVKDLSLSIYSPTQSKLLNDDNYRLSIDNNKCCAEMESGEIKLVCPEGEICVLTVEQTESGLKDSVRIRNLNQAQKKMNELSKKHYLRQKALVEEQAFRFGKVIDPHPLGAVYTMLRANLLN